MINKLKELLDKNPNVSEELIDRFECRIMGVINTFDITLLNHDYTYSKSVVNKDVGAGCVFPIDTEGNVYLETQYRFNLRDLLLELPAGRCDEGESYFDCAKRELKEETGLTSNNIIGEYDYYIQADFTDEELGSFLALDVAIDGEQELDHDESVNVIKMPLDVCEELIKRNILIDERTIISYGLAKLFHDVKIPNTPNKEEIIDKVKNKIEEDKEKLKEEEVDISYTYPCEFGFVQDHIVKTSKMINTRRECMYMKAGKIVIPVSKNGKIGLKVKYMPAIKKNSVQLPVYEEFSSECKFQEFGKLATAIGYANDMQELYLLKDIEETENYLWCTVDEIKEVIKEQMIKDGKVLAALLKYLSI